MKNRRNFIKTATIVTAGVLAAPVSSAFAGRHSFTRGIIYTKNNPGKWEAKTGSHLPVVTVDGQKITIETKHGMSEKHYIVRHTLVAGNGDVLGEKTFYPSSEKALSVFEVKEEHAVLYATSFCNQHDLWVVAV